MCPSDYLIFALNWLFLFWNWLPRSDSQSFSFHAWFRSWSQQQYTFPLLSCWYLWNLFFLPASPKVQLSLASKALPLTLICNIAGYYPIFWCKLVEKNIFHYIGNIMNGIGLIMGKYEHISTYSKVFCASLSTSYLSIILPYFLLFLKLTLWKCNEPIVICLVSFFGLLFSLQFHFWLYQSLWYF